MQLQTEGSRPGIARKPRVRGGVHVAVLTDAKEMQRHQVLAGGEIGIELRAGELFELAFGDGPVVLGHGALGGPQDRMCAGQMIDQRLSH